MGSRTRRTRDALAVIRLGDLDKRQCRALEQRLSSAAAAFGRLADELLEGQTVGQRWTVQELQTIVGDNLAGAASDRPIW